MSEQIIERLVGIAGEPRQVGQDAYLFHQGDAVRSVYIIAGGLIELVRHQPGGAAIVLQRAAARTVLAEASLYSARYHCDALAAQPSSVFKLPKSVFHGLIRTDETFANFWAAYLAAEVQSARYRSEILSLRTVAERLDGWLAWRGSGLPPKGEWKSIAAEIGVSPEALYRELAKRRS